MFYLVNILKVYLYGSFPLQARSLFMASSPVAGSDMLLVNPPGKTGSGGFVGGGVRLNHDSPQTNLTKAFSLLFSHVNQIRLVSPETAHLKCEIQQ